MCFLCKQKTAYEMRISYWSADVCSSDLLRRGWLRDRLGFVGHSLGAGHTLRLHIVEGHHLAGRGGFLGRSSAESEGTLRALTIMPRSRSEERRVGKECVSTCRFRCSADLSKKKSTAMNQYKEDQI